MNTQCRVAAGNGAPTMSDQEHAMAVSARMTPQTGQDEVRLRLKPGMLRTGFVDGGWWPRSRDLLAELPELADALRASVGRVERVAFARSMWDAVPARRRGWADGRRIGLDGFAAFAPDTIWVVTPTTRNTPIFLVVVPPETPPALAADVLRQAAEGENLDEPDDLLGHPGRPRSRPHRPF